MNKQPSPWLRRVGSAALFATLGATIVGFGIAGAVDGGSTSTSTPSTPSSEGGKRHARPNLTAEQKTCLTNAGITKPEGRPTQAMRDAFKAAAETCGITLPARNGRSGHPRLNLTDEQKTCLTNAGITKPEGRPTQEQVDAMKAAAAACGVTPHARPSTEPGLGAPDEAPVMGGRFGDGHGMGGRFGRGFHGPGPSGSTGTGGAPVAPTSGS